ncbi:MAG TPA: sodium-translocating pyrophosphatase [Longimicrobiaceae bacterium]|nr:sodium-translocating pyrophosphatase [Longimicrobiaceae bacterium]
MTLTDLAWLAWPLGLLALGSAFVLLVRVQRHPMGNEALRELALQIQGGAIAFLRRQYGWLAAFVAVGAGALWLAINWQTALAFVLGAFASMLAGVLGILAATRANVRAAEAAHSSGRELALRIAFDGGAVTGLAVGGLGLLGIGLFYFALIYLQQAWLAEEYVRFAEILSGFALGASGIALFTRVGGGVFTKAADVGADLVGKVEAGMPEDDPRNPAAIANHVGDAVGDTAGMGADLFESYVGSVVAAVVLGATAPLFTSGDQRMAAVALPILAAMLGLLASAVGLVLLRALGRARPVKTLRLVALATSGLFVVMAFAVVWALGFDLEDAATGRVFRPMGPFWALLAGAVAAGGVGLATELYTTGRPARRLVRAAEGGPATSIISGLAVGLESTAVPVLLLGAAVWVSYFAAGLYGIGLAAVGMLSTVALNMTVDAYGPIADNASGLARMSHLGTQARQVTDELDAAGKTTAAIGKGLAAASATLTALALFSAFAASVGLQAVDLADPEVLVGLLLGGLVPVFVASLALTAVGRAARRMVEEVRRQLREIPGIMEGTTPPDSARCVDISTRAALRAMVAPGVIGLVVPLLVGLLVGVDALAGVLAGATVTGVLLALFMANAGGAWDNARKQLELSGHAERDPAVHVASVVSDAVGDPLKDVAGPAMNILVKLMAVVALVIAPLLAGGRSGLEAPADEFETVVELVREVVAALVG